MTTLLSGGTGTPKLLSDLMPNSEITVIGNTGDDIEMGDLLICPDLDTIMYLSAGVLNKDTWWGIEGDTFETHEYLVRSAKEKGWEGAPNFLGRAEQINGREIAKWRRFSGEEEFMQIGDMDRSIHMLRSRLIDEGRTLTEATENLCSLIDANIRLLPMSDDPVSSILSTNRGEMHFQGFWAGLKGEPEVKDIEYRGSGVARATKLVTKALKNQVIIGPSNPIPSVGPILSLKGIKKLLSETKVVAVSPFIGDRAFSGPIKKLMSAKGHEANTAGLMEMYPFVDVFVIDSSDKIETDRKVVKTDIRINSTEDAKRVYGSCLEALEEIE